MMPDKIAKTLKTIGYKSALIDLQRWVNQNAANLDTRTLRALNIEIGRLNEETDQNRSAA